MGPFIHPASRRLPAESGFVLVSVRLSKLPSRQPEHMWTVLHPKFPTRKRGVDEQGVIGTVGSVRPVDMPEDVQHGLHRLHGGKKLVTPFVTIGAGSHIENAIGGPCVTRMSVLAGMSE